MNSKIVEGLLELGLYTYEPLQKEEYEAKSTEETDKIYITGKDDSGYQWYREVDTKGLSTEEIKLLLEIDRTQNVRKIRKSVTFFVVLTIISICIGIIGALVAMS